MMLKLALGNLLTVFLVSAMADNHSIADGLNHSPTEWLIEAYSSAAPAYVGGHATVTGDNGKVLRQGTNDWTFMTLNPRPFPKTGWTDEHDAMPGCADTPLARLFYDFE